MTWSIIGKSIPCKFLTFRLRKNYFSCFFHKSPCNFTTNFNTTHQKWPGMRWWWYWLRYISQNWSDYKLFRKLTKQATGWTERFRKLLWSPTGDVTLVTLVIHQSDRSFHRSLCSFGPLVGYANLFTCLSLHQKLETLLDSVHLI